MMKNILALLFVSSILVAGGDEASPRFRGPSGKSMSKSTEGMSKEERREQELKNFYQSQDCPTRCIMDITENPCLCMTLGPLCFCGALARGLIEHRLKKSDKKMS